MKPRDDGEDTSWFPFWCWYGATTAPNPICRDLRERLWVPFQRRNKEIGNVLRASAGFEGLGRILSHSPSRHPAHHAKRHWMGPGRSMLDRLRQPPATWRLE